MMRVALPTIASSMLAPDRNDGGFFRPPSDVEGPGETEGPGDEKPKSECLPGVCGNTGRIMCRATGDGPSRVQTIETVQKKIRGAKLLSSNPRNGFLTLQFDGLEGVRDPLQEVKANAEILDRLRDEHPDLHCEPDCLMCVDQVKALAPPTEQIPPFVLPDKYSYFLEPRQCGDDASDVWGLDRTDQADLALDGTYDRDGCLCSGLEKTVAFVIDTGIQPHTEFNYHQRYIWQLSFGSRLMTQHCLEFDTDPNNPVQQVGDSHGHGTHVAGTIGGLTVGVNPCTKLVGYRVFPKNSGSTPSSKIIAAIEHVAERANDPDDFYADYNKVINLSVGGWGNSSLYQAAVDAAFDAGVTVVVAAGNSNGDACNYQPAFVPNAITVGSTNSADEISWFSNYGDCVDIQAPGSAINSARSSETEFNSNVNTGYISDSGTSMASPHVAGVATLALAHNLANNPSTVNKFIKCTAADDRLDMDGKSGPNSLLQKNLSPFWRWWCNGGKLIPKPYEPLPFPDFIVTPIIPNSDSAPTKTLAPVEKGKTYKYAPKKFNLGLGGGKRSLADRLLEEEGH